MHALMIAGLIVIGVLLFGFVIFFHELGHFLLAKAGGILVYEFSIGMGPKLFQFKKGDTQYTLRLFPIGGYCAMGEDEESTDERAFSNKPVWRRILVIIAGGVFNIILGFFLMLIVLGQQDTYATTTIAKFAEDSRLEIAGAQVGDQILEIDGYAVYTDRDLSFALALADPTEVSMKVRRDGKKVDLGTFSLAGEVGEDGKPVISMDFWVQPEARTFWGLVRRSAVDTFSMARMVLESLKGIVSGRFGLNDIAGPVGTAQVISQAASAGLAEGFGQAVNNIVMMIILITVNLGVVNLLPLPALDGGRLLFLIWEGITRKPVPQKYEGYVHAVGFILLMVLMVVITFSDILRLFRG
ncbi:RIP metalloprotease [uncultured Neglectibacter sp.]|uniref:M50 family metallopeptidase n=1 Tax=uncultured Neglectibacter sp. TaxID=1924108 RepID=UPI0034DE562D